jgi:hypothetical protein
MTIRVLDPRQPPDGDATALAPALADLRGAVVGLLDNAKMGTAGLYDHLEQLLRSRYGVREFIRRRKPDTTRPAPDAVLAELSGCDAIVSGVGD